VLDGISEFRQAGDHGHHGAGAAQVPDEDRRQEHAARETAARQAQEEAPVTGADLALSFVCGIIVLAVAWVIYRGGRRPK
jgi:hypothetical protein